MDKCIYNSNLKFCYTSPSVHESLSNSIKIVHKPDIDVDSAKAKQLTSLLLPSHMPARVIQSSLFGAAGETTKPVSLVALQTNGASSTALLSTNAGSRFVVPDVLHCTFQHFYGRLHIDESHSHSLKEDSKRHEGGATKYMNKHQAKLADNAGRTITFASEDTLLVLLAKHGDSRDKNRFALMMETPQKYVALYAGRSSWWWWW